jgi:hypothetical protein
MADNEEWIDAHSASEILKVSARQVYNYGIADPPRVRTKKVGWRVLYLKSDAERLAKENSVNERPRTRTTPKTDLMPASEALNYIREIQNQLNSALIEIGRLQARAEMQQMLTQDNENLRHRLAESEAKATELQLLLNIERQRNGNM